MTENNMTTGDVEKQAQDAAFEAFKYGLPMVENYVLMYDKAGKISPLAFNRLASSAELCGPDDTDVVTPNNDTAYSSAWLDLRAEPQVLTVPAILHKRYWSFQFIDFFTNNYAYLGSRCEVGHPHEASYLLVGPNWRETDVAPKGMEVICADTDLVLLLGRTQVFGADDIPTVENIQAQYRLTPLHVYLDQPAPPAAPAIDFIATPGPSEMASSLTPEKFFPLMNLSFDWSAVPKEHAGLLAQFAAINVGPGLSFDLSTFDQSVQDAIAHGVAEAYAAIKFDADNGDVVAGWKVMDMDKPFFGTKADDIMFRAVVAYKGIYAHSPIEAVYPIANYDVNKEPLDGNGRYTITFPAGQLPPVNFFWSLSMYGANQLFVDNDIDRYSISDRTEGIRFENDKSLTIYLQPGPPAEGYGNNWLPTPSNPDGIAPFYVVLRLYGPKQHMLDGGYQTPGLIPQ